MTILKDVVMTLKVKVEQVKSITTFSQVTNLETEVETTEYVDGKEPMKTNKILMREIVQFYV